MRTEADRTRTNRSNRTNQIKSYRHPLISVSPIVVRFICPGLCLCQSVCLPVLSASLWLGSLWIGSRKTNSARMYLVFCTGFHLDLHMLHTSKNMICNRYAQDTRTHPTRAKASLKMDVSTKLAVSTFLLAKKTRSTQQPPPRRPTHEGEKRDTRYVRTRQQRQR